VLGLLRRGALEHPAVTWRRWTYDEKLLVKRLWGRVELVEIAERVGRTPHAVRTYADAKLLLGSPNEGTTTIGALARETGYAETRIRAAIEHLGLVLRPKPHEHEPPAARGAARHPAAGASAHPRVPGEAARRRAAPSPRSRAWARLGRGRPPAVLPDLPAHRPPALVPRRLPHLLRAEATRASARSTGMRPNHPPFKTVAREVALGAPVIAWLRERGWDVYQEVVCGNDVADIVATQGRLVAVVELKRSFSLDVIAQAHRWARLAHVSWVAVPEARWDAGRELGYQVCEDRGVGVLILRRPGRDERDIEQKRAPALRRKVDAKLRRTLCPEHKTFAAAGTASGARWSDFQRTCRDLRALVKAEPGVALRDLFAKPSRHRDGMSAAEVNRELLQHHYSSDAVARRCLAKLIEQGVVEGLRLEREPGAVRLFLAETAKP
jgi:hypothetical protein